MTNAGFGPADRRGEAGFTLVELLVAIALLSFVSVALFGALRFGMSAFARGSAQTERVEQIAFTQNLLRRLIENAYPLFLSGDPTRPRVAFDGSTKSISFLAPAPIAIDAGGMSLFAVSADERDGRVNLALTSRPELAVQGDTAAPARKMLLDGAQAIEFSYFGKARSDRAPQWHDDWKGEASMPDLVRIRTRFAADDARLWPELVVAPRIGADVTCTYDTLTKRCRGR